MVELFEWSRYVGLGNTSDAWNCDTEKYVSFAIFSFACLEKAGHALAFFFNGYSPQIADDMF